MSSKRQTQKKGDIALSKAIYDFTRLGYEVSLPITESATYDLIVDNGENLFRVQAKFLGETVKGVDMRRIHSNSKGYVVKRYKEGDYDWLYVYKDKGNTYISTDFILTQEYRPKEKDLIESHNVVSSNQRA